MKQEMNKAYKKKLFLAAMLFLVIGIILQFAEVPGVEENIILVISFICIILSMVFELMAIKIESNNENNKSK